MTLCLKSAQININSKMATGSNGILINHCSSHGHTQDDSHRFHSRPIRYFSAPASPPTQLDADIGHSFRQQYLSRQTLGPLSSSLGVVFILYIYRLLLFDNHGERLRLVCPYRHFELAWQEI